MNATKNTTALIIEAERLDFIKDCLKARGYRPGATGWLRLHGNSVSRAHVRHNGRNWFTVVRQ